MTFSQAVINMGLPEAAPYFGQKRTDVIDFSIGEPRDSPPESVKNAYERSLRGKETSRYAPVQGMPKLRDALASKLRRTNGIDATADRVMVTGGASEAIAYSIMSLVGRGEQAIIVEPSYPIMAPMVRFCGGRPVSLELNHDKGFRPAIEKLKELVGPRTSMLLINSPHNPTGTVFRKGELRAFSEVFGGHILTDEVYENYTYDSRHESIASFCERPERVITVNSFSKTYCMCGYRVGYLHASRELIGHMTKLKLCVSTCTSRPAQEAALAGLDDREFPAEMRRRFEERRRLMLRGLRGLGLPHVAPQGAFYVFPSISEFGNDRDVFSLFEKAGVLAMPGSLFHEAYPDHMRLSFTAPINEIREGIERLEGVLT